MTEPGIWTILGIGPTQDTASIRRAYATKLKALQPDADPQGFAALRSAYEAALAATATSENDRSAGLNPPLPRPSEAAPETTGAVASADILGQCLDEGDVLAAADRLLAARTRGALSLQDDLVLTDRLGWAMAQDHDIPPASVHAAAERLGWLQAWPATDWAVPLQARIEAETWIADLRRDAASWTAWVGSARAIAARILLGKGNLRTVPSMGRDPNLIRAFREFVVHEPVIGNQFDPVRIGDVKRLVGRPVKRSMPVGLRVLRWLRARKGQDGPR